MKKLVVAVLVVLSTMAVSAVSIHAQELSAADLDKRRKTLMDLLHEQWEYTLRTSPEFASILGDRRYNDQVGDFSEKAVLADLAMTRKFLRRFEAIDTRGFSEQERLNRDLMVRGLRESLAAAPFVSHRMPVNQMSGIHLFLPQLPSMLQFATVKDYDDYLARLA